MISSKDLFSLKGNTAIVTGGTSGIGRCTADYLASAGANVAIISRHADMAKTVAKAISEEYDVLTVGIGCDVSDPVAVDHMIDTVSRAIGTADILLNNAGININGSALELNYEDWQHILDVNVNGVFLTARAFAKKLIAENKQGSVINMASISASIVNLPQSQTAYNTSKAAVVHMTKTLAIEWVKWGIRVNAVSPGYVWTEMNQIVPKEISDVWMASTPFKRFAKPDEIAGAVIYFASKASSYTTGSELLVDGGFTCL
ncbi:MAG: SDR family oxidoreductase [Vallitaleaceae bacterium]|jgi:sorbose reductase|nr:SDR family oxidoreductase [Vallitaleaceae bacterium]